MKDNVSLGFQGAHGQLHLEGGGEEWEVTEWEGYSWGSQKEKWEEGHGHCVSSAPPLQEYCVDRREGMTFSTH